MKKPPENSGGEYDPAKGSNNRNSIEISDIAFRGRRSFKGYWIIVLMTDIGSQRTKDAAIPFNVIALSPFSAPI
jgi:hypothetical protein